MHDEVGARAKMPPAETGAHRPWTKPQLREFGEAKTLTLRVDNLGKNDGGRWPTRRT